MHKINYTVLIIEKNPDVLGYIFIQSQSLLPLTLFYTHTHTIGADL